MGRASLPSSSSSFSSISLNKKHLLPQTRYQAELRPESDAIPVLMTFLGSYNVALLPAQATLSSLLGAITALCTLLYTMYYIMAFYRAHEG